MKREEVNIRDPFVLVSGDTYYLYGTRSATCWGPADGFDCYCSRDLENWDGPVEIFHRPEGFWADRSYWAPECYEIEGTFYLIATLGGEDRKKAVYRLTADAPTGPFGEPVRLTPADWASIDGTLWKDANGWWLIFSHSFEDLSGHMCALRLDEELRPAGEPIVLFHASEAAWSVPIPFAKAEFGMDGDVYFSDGPFAWRMENGALMLIWSSWGKGGYTVGMARSDSGSVEGPWVQLDTPLFPGGGGHGMVFRTKEGALLYTLHTPETKYEERPTFFPLEECDGTLKLTLASRMF